MREREREESHGSYVDLIRHTCVLLRSPFLSLPFSNKINNNIIMIMIMVLSKLREVFKKTMFHVFSYNNDGEPPLGGRRITDQRYVIRREEIWLESRGEPGKGER